MNRGRLHVFISHIVSLEGSLMRQPHHSDICADRYEDLKKCKVKKQDHTFFKYNRMDVLVRYWI